MFIIEVTYKISSEDIDVFNKPHFDFINSAYQKQLILLSGYKKPREGEIFITNHTNIEQVQAWLNDNIIYRKNIGDFKVTEFNVTQYHPNFKKLIADLKDKNQLITEALLFDQVKYTPSLFITDLSYRVSLEDIDNNLTAHKEFLNSAYRDNVILISGRKNPREGGIILSLYKTKEQLINWCEQDPFYKLAYYNNIEFTPMQYNPKFIDTIK